MRALEVVDSATDTEGLRVIYRNGREEKLEECSVAVSEGWLIVHYEDGSERWISNAVIDEVIVE